MTDNPVPPPARRAPPLVREWPITVVLAAVAVGLVVVWDYHFRRGVTLIAVAICAAAALRLLLPARRTGLLAVRSRAFDVASYLVLGVTMLVLGLVLPTGE